VLFRIKPGTRSDSRERRNVVIHPQNNINDLHLQHAYVNLLHQQEQYNNFQNTSNTSIQSNDSFFSNSMSNSLSLVNVPWTHSSPNSSLPNQNQQQQQQQQQQYVIRPKPSNNPNANMNKSCTKVQKKVPPEPPPRRSSTMQTPPQQITLRQQQHAYQQAQPCEYQQHQTSIKVKQTVIYQQDQIYQQQQYLLEQRKLQQQQYIYQQQANELQMKLAETLRKRQYRIGLNLFNKKPEKGIAYLIQNNFLENSPHAVAKFFVSFTSIKIYY
jgi:hypothetical protein